MKKMEKLFNLTSLVGGFWGGLLVYLFGGWNQMLTCMLILVGLDYFTGLCKAYKKKELSSRVGFAGLLKKMVVFIIIATAYQIQIVIKDAIPLREVVLTFYICNEALSLLENAAEFVPIPKKLKEVLIQLRDKEE